METRPLRGSSPLFFRNGQILGLSPIRKRSTEKIFKIMAMAAILGFDRNKLPDSSYQVSSQVAFLFRIEVHDG